MSPPGHPSGSGLLFAFCGVVYDGRLRTGALASIPRWMEWVIDKKYPTWRAVPTTIEGRAGIAPAGLRVLEAVLAQAFGADQVAVCSPDQLPTFIGERTRLVAVSSHNPLSSHCRH